ncbi:MAG: hypothetical protein U5K37_06400 [Natrialbaceae archaeon]|nr:hypothetical protein [Natrialbaceae archaeon]
MEVDLGELPDHLEEQVRVVEALDLVVEVELLEDLLRLLVEGA